MQLLLLFPCNNPTAHAALNVPQSFLRPTLAGSLSLETHRERSVSAEHHSGNFRNEQVENGGGHVHQSVNRTPRTKVAGIYKSDPRQIQARVSLESTLHYFRSRINNVCVCV